MTANTTPEHTSQARRIGPAISALTQALLLVGGLPLLLVRGVGWPLPHAMPQWVEVTRAYQLQYIPNRFVIGAIACAGWVCWVMIMTSLVQGAIAHIRATDYRRPRLVIPGVHGLVTKWIAAATLTVALLARPAGAATVSARTAVTQSIPINTGAATTKQPAKTPETTIVRTEPANGPTSRTIVTGEHQTYWDIAESTLGDGQRWREILNANPQIGNVDLVPAGITINIPGGEPKAGRTVVVEPGDNLWDIAATELADAHDGKKPTNNEIVPYWQEVIATNESDLRSQNPNLVYPGETIQLPTLNDDRRSDGFPPASSNPPTILTTTTTAVAATVPTRLPIAVPIPVTTIPAATLATSTVVEEIPANVEIVDDVDTNFEIPWLQGLAVTGIAAAGILAAWHAQRRRRIRNHKPGDPIPVMSEPDRELISQLRAIASERQHAAVDTAFRYLATTIGEHGEMPSITVARAGRHSVELLLDNPQTSTPAGFLRLDQQTIVINPGTTDEDITTAITNRKSPAPTLIALGTDDIGTLLIDLERTGALAIEAATEAEAIAVAVAMLTELATQPWAEGLTVLAHGVPDTANPDARIAWLDDIDELISRAEGHYQSQSDEIVTLGTHTVRARTNESVSPLVVVLGPGTPDEAKALAAAATQPGSGLALICCDAIPNSAWRLVTNNGRTTIEPTGLTVEARHLRPSKLDEQANQAIVTTFGKPTSEPTDELPTSDSEDLSGKHVPTEVETAEPAGLDEQSVEENSEEPPKVDVTVAEELLPNVEVAEPTVSSRLAVSTRFDQMMLLPEPHPDAPPPELSVAEKINHIMRRRPVELVLLNGPPRLEGITWNGKDAARVDEIVAFLALNGPSTLSQVATAIWPEKVRPGDTAKQLICRARKTLGLTAEGNPRITAGTRSAPYRLTDVGCDWHRFEQLCTLAETEQYDDRSRLLQTALSLVRTPPFEAARTGAFHWASDICFDSRMRLKISEATHRYEAQANEPDREWAQEIRLTVSQALVS